jgi:hypothetical protein
MQSERPSFSRIGSLVVRYDENHVNIGPAPDLIFVHFRAVSATATGPFLETLLLTDGYEDAEFRADGIVTYSGSYLLTLEGTDPLLLTYSGMSDVGEEAYEQMIDDVLPTSVRLDASARFFTSTLKYRWLNKLHCNARGDRDFRDSSGFYELFASFADGTERS